MKKSLINILIYSLPIFIIFVIVLLAYWPGILVSDSMVQWHQTQTQNFNDWHPAYNTIYIYILTCIWNNPGFVLLIQCLILSLCASFVITRLEKYYKINKIYLFIMCILFAIIPLNFNFAVTLLKDTLYSTFILLLVGLIIEIINDPCYFKKIHKCLLLLFALLAIALFRHNGILVVMLTMFILIIKYRKQKAIYFTTAAFLAIYLLLTTVGFNILNVKEGNFANKYGPISHIMARLLNTEGVHLTENELATLSQYVDIDKLKETYNPYNMDFSINSQNIDVLKEKGSDYLKFAIKVFIKHPKEVITHYIHLTSFLYSPVPFYGSYTVGMFIETDLWEYSDEYYYLNENSKIPTLLPFLKNIEIKYQDGKLGEITMRPALYMYLSILFICILCYIKKSKSLLFILIPTVANTLSLAPAIPVAMTRYVYSTMLVFYFIFTIS